MFRRKEESLFDTDFAAEEETVTVVQATANTAPAAAAPATQTAPATAAASTTAPASNAATGATVAQSTASQQPISRPAAVPPAVQPTSFRPNTPVNSPITSATTSISRPAEVKSMNPMSNLSSQNNSQNTKAANRVLTVGNDILLKGEINSCDRLVIEGKLEATLNDVHTVELAEVGSFKGSANVVEAQISGLFEGDLVVTGRLVIYASGKVRGNISYGEIEIERGGELSGNIKMGNTASTPKALNKVAA